MADPFIALVPVETGLVPHVALPDLSPAQMAALAREIVVDLRNRADILKDYSLSAEQFKALQQNTFFKRTFETFSVEWNSALSTVDRIRLVAAFYHEQGLPTLAARMMNTKEELRDAVEVGKMLAKSAGIGETATSGVPGEKFTINIDLGGDKSLRIEKDVTPTKTPTNAGTMGVDTKGDSGPATLQKLPEGTRK